MPTYDYRCAACGHVLEAFQSIREPALKKCPKCRKLRLERQIGSGAGILFKGGGFYQTDYRSESYKKSESTEKSGGEKPAARTESSGKAAPAKSEKPSKKKADGSGDG